MEQDNFCRNCQEEIYVIGQFCSDKCEEQYEEENPNGFCCDCGEALEDDNESPMCKSCLAGNETNIY